MRCADVAVIRTIIQGELKKLISVETHETYILGPKNKTGDKQKQWLFLREQTVRSIQLKM